MSHLFPLCFFSPDSNKRAESIARTTDLSPLISSRSSALLKNELEETRGPVGDCLADVKLDRQSHRIVYDEFPAIAERPSISGLWHSDVVGFACDRVFAGKTTPNPCTLPSKTGGTARGASPRLLHLMHDSCISFSERRTIFLAQTQH